MISASTILVMKFAAAIISLVAAFLKLRSIDKKRQTAKPEFMRCYATDDDGVVTATRRPPAMAGKPLEKVAHFDDIAGQMKTGDVLTFSGRTFWSYLLRIATFSDKSHCGMVYRDDEGLWIIDSCEGRNVTKRPLADEVKKYPGQWYWHSIRREFQHNYHRHRAAEMFLAMVTGHTRYGWIGIGLQFFCHTPVLREIAYLTRLDRLPIYLKRLFCSQALKRVMRHGSLDPVPGRDEQLCTPQDINQSLSINEGVALV